VRRHSEPPHPDERRKTFGIGRSKSKSVDLPAFFLYKGKEQKNGCRVFRHYPTSRGEIMETKRTRLTSRLLWVMLIISILAALWPWLSMRKIDARLMENPPHNGIVAFELVCDAPDALKMIDAWGPELSLLAGKSIKIDFFFIPAYVLLFFAATMLFSLLASGLLRKLIRAVAYLPIVAGIADIIENTFLLLILRSSRNIPDHYPLVAGTCASVKFMLLAVVVAFWLVAIAALIVRKMRERPTAP
jgi:hypothetical protein